MGQKEDRVNELEVLVPVPGVSSGEIRMPERLKDFRGKRICFLWNNKSNGDILFKHLEIALRDRFKLADTFMKKKSHSSSGVLPEILEELSTGCDYVILAMGD